MNPRLIDPLLEGTIEVSLLLLLLLLSHSSRI